MPDGGPPGDPWPEWRARRWPVSRDLPMDRLPVIDSEQSGEARGRRFSTSGPLVALGTTTRHSSEEGMAAHPHGSRSPGPLAATTEMRLRVAIALTALFVLIEAIAGILAHSLALLSDAGHNLTDRLALVLSLWAFELARRPSTAE